MLSLYEIWHIYLILDIHEVMNKLSSFQLFFKASKNTKNINVKEHTKDNRIFDVIYFIFGGTLLK